MNGSEVIHPFNGICDKQDGSIDDEIKKLNTGIASCLEYAKRLLGLACEIHSHKFHSCYIVVEANGEQDEGKMRVALGMV